MQRGRALATVIEQLSSREPVNDIRTEEWYNMDMNGVNSEVQQLFYPSSVDTETYEFLNSSVSVSQSICLQIFYTFTTVLLRAFVTKTTINGLLERGRMFVFSTDQLAAFLKIDGTWKPEDKAMIDLGAGDGHVTWKFKPFFQKVYATEASRIMEWRLGQKGFHVLPKEDWKSRGPFNLISALNLLDRFYDPPKLLGDIHEVALRDDSLVLMAVVLPLSQYVEFQVEGRQGNAPNNRIQVIGKTTQSHLNSIIRDVFKPAGFQVIRWTRLPYLCEGDVHKPFYKLNDFVFLLKAIPRDPLPSTPAKIHSINEIERPLKRVDEL